MPTDENNWVVSQNQQTDLNWSWNQFVQNSETSDDFDFNFDDKWGDTSTVDNASAWWDSHIFTNPDSSESQDIQSQPVINQWRTGMFKTPDEQDNQQQDATSSASSNEDSFLSDIDPDDVQNNDGTETLGGWDLFDQNSENESQEASNEALDQNIEEMISFDDSPVEQKENTVQEPSVDIQPDVSAEENNVNTSNVQEVSNIQEVATETQNNPDIMAHETVNTVQEDVPQSWETNGDDWLQQEDKEVENAFGSQDSTDSSSLLNVNMSWDDVAQNVENIITNQDENVQQNDATYVPDENEYSQMSDLLNSSSTWQVDLNNVPAQAVADQSAPIVDNLWASVAENASVPVVEGTWVSVEENMSDSIDENISAPVVENVWVSFENSIPASVVENDWVPSVENPGPIDMNNVWTFWWTPNTVDTSNLWWDDQNVGFGLWALNATMPAETSIVVENPTVAETPTILENSVAVEGSSVSETPATVENQVMVESSAVQNPVQNESFNLDSIEQDIQNLSIWSQVLQQEGQNMVVDQWQVWWQVQVQDSQVQNGQVVQQSQPIKRGKKQSWFKVIWIFLWVVALLFGLWFAATKMFPDKFNLKSIFWWDKIVEYIDNSWIVWDSWIIDDENENNNVDWDEIVWEEDENLEMNADEDSLEVDGENIDEENSDVDENAVWNESSDVNQSEEESSQHDSKNWWDVLDPNSLAALLSDDIPENNQDWDWSVTEEGSDGTIDENVDETANQVDDGDSSFDPFAEMNDLLDENADNKAKLQDYLSKWELYKDLWTVNGNKSMEKIWEFIMTKAQEQLTKLENWEEIDTTVFELLEKRLEQAQNLANN